jgi:DNA-binding beta-propeller fold protein YncE
MRTSIGNDRVQLFDQQGNFLAMWGRPDSGVGKFDNLHGIIMDGLTSWIYVADTGNNRIQVFKRKQ